ncbi:hypothetical protein F7725_007436 [Dissostichus mawsoni]|uniref:Uncharacterized protein n=1 Tax=Dissostichus mawsoni TaxID=36200 RepID=A0A7J5XWS1_DISMA|nr:hypothetical protein F7725_007436 [Dissostichus mawsoni]
MLSESVTQRQEMGNQLKQEDLLERTNLLELKAKLKKEREDLDRESEVMNKEKLDFDLIRSEIKKQRDMLEQQRQDIKKKEKLEVTKTDLKKDKLENIMSMIVLNKKTKTQGGPVQQTNTRTGYQKDQSAGRKRRTDLLRKDLKKKNKSNAHNEKDRMERGMSDLKTREDLLLNTMKSMEILRKNFTS